MVTCSISCVLPLCCTSLKICSDEIFYKILHWPLRHSVGVEFARLGLF